MSITITDIETAAERIAGDVLHTPRLNRPAFQKWSAAIYG